MESLKKVLETIYNSQERERNELGVLLPSTLSLLVTVFPWLDSKGYIHILQIYLL